MSQKPYPKTYHFTGTATVSVCCKVEATSERAARRMVKARECEWQCDEVDGDVLEVELTEVED